MALVDSATVKQIVGIHAAITTFDTLIAAAADAGSSMVLARLGMSTLAVHTYTEWPTVYNNTQRKVQLKHWPVTAIVALTNGTSLLETDDYRVEEPGQLVLTGARSYLDVPVPRLQTSYWSDAPDGVQVTYTAGWTDATVPGELKAAAQLIAVDFYNRAPKAGVDEQRTRGWYSIQSEMDIPPMARAILARYSDGHV